MVARIAYFLIRYCMQLQIAKWGCKKTVLCDSLNEGYTALEQSYTGPNLHINIHYLSPHINIHLLNSLNKQAIFFFFSELPIQLIFPSNVIYLYLWK